MRRHATSTSDPVGISRPIARIRSRHRGSSFRSTSSTMVGFVVAPTAPCTIASASSSDAQLSFQKSVAVVATVWCSGPRYPPFVSPMVMPPARSVR